MGSDVPQFLTMEQRVAEPVVAKGCAIETLPFAGQARCIVG